MRKDTSAYKIGNLIPLYWELFFRFEKETNFHLNNNINLFNEGLALKVYHERQKALVVSIILRLSPLPINCDFFSRYLIIIKYLPIGWFVSYVLV